MGGLHGHLYGAAAGDSNLQNWFCAAFANRLTIDASHHKGDGYRISDRIAPMNSLSVRRKGHPPSGFDFNSRELSSARDR
jgi:hypothetical protein